MSILPTSETSCIPLPELKAISNIRKRSAEIDPPAIKKQRTSRVALAVLTNKPSTLKEGVSDFSPKAKKKDRIPYVFAIDKENKPGYLQIVEFNSPNKTDQQEFGKNPDEKGLKEAMTGLRLEDEGKIDEALTHYNASVALGNPRGETYLGIYYLEKIPDKKGHREGFELFKSSALKKDALGQAYLGYCYLKGFGTLPSTDRALYYCNLSVKQGEKQGFVFRDMCLKQFEKLGLTLPYQVSKK